MAKTKPSKRKDKQRKKSKKDVLHSTTAPSHRSSSSSKPAADPATLLTEATTLLATGQALDALPLAQQALTDLSSVSSNPLPALNLLAEIHIELGDPETATSTFAKAIELDPMGDRDDAATAADKFLWMAQLSSEGGKDSVGWFEKGVGVLKTRIAEVEGKKTQGPMEVLVASELKGKLANALCGVVEVYMTDLRFVEAFVLVLTGGIYLSRLNLENLTNDSTSWEQDAEQRCEQLITEALLVAPSSPSVLQTLASIRISQLRFPDAQAALNRSIDLWKDLPPEDPEVPDFPTRISLARLLMEAEMEGEAFEVLDRLILEDDSSVEGWYLGGWCLMLLAQKEKGTVEESETKKTLLSSREWLRHTFKLYEMQEYEDERLGEHARELVKDLDAELGAETLDESDGEEWEDADDLESEEDEEMED